MPPELVAGLVLAAGAGTRFGDSPKLLAELDGRPLLQWAVRAQCDVPALARVLVVLGARAAQVRDRVDFGRAETIVCEDWETGQAASLRAGLQALAGVWKVIVTLGDQPLITRAVIERFVGEPAGTRAVYDGRPGHPVVLGAEHRSRLLSTGGEGGRGSGDRSGAGNVRSRDRGARDLLRGGPVIEVSHLCSGRDVDTPDDLEAIRDEARAVI